MCIFSSASTLTLLDQCSFENENICGMIQSTTDDLDWVHQQSSATGDKDHTLSGRCTGKKQHQNPLLRAGVTGVTVTFAHLCNKCKHI